LRTEVKRLFAGRSRAIIGVHIRYADRKVSLVRIATELARLRKRVPEVSIFPATTTSGCRRGFGGLRGRFVIDKVLGDDANCSTSASWSTTRGARRRTRPGAPHLP
jgi:hypothetical protein